MVRRYYVICAYVRQKLCQNFTQFDIIEVPFLDALLADAMCSMTEQIGLWRTSIITITWYMEYYMCLYVIK